MMTPKWTTPPLVALIAVAVLVVGAAGKRASTCEDGDGCTCSQCDQAGYDYFCSSNSECYSYEVECGAECNNPCESTSACTGCSDGDNCTCTQCDTRGYSYYCPKARECYNSEITCEISCGSRNCVSTQSCQPKMTCDDTNLCPGTTCCVSTTGQQFCAATANAVCCQYDNMTCPKGMMCDPPTGQCLTPNPNPGPNCNECQTVVTEIESKGTDVCNNCNTYFPQFVFICEIIKLTGLCNYIVSHALPPQEMCEMVGFCGQGSCPCGYCKPSLYGQWCLATPNVCPQPNGSALVSQSMAAVEKHLVGPAVEPTTRQLKGDDYCLDGWCDARNVGCCLTCAP